MSFINVISKGVWKNCLREGNWNSVLVLNRPSGRGEAVLSSVNSTDLEGVYVPHKMSPMCGREIVFIASGVPLTR